MAQRFLVPIDLGQNELILPRIHNVSGAPSSPVEGQIYFNSTSGVKTMLFWNGMAWVDMSGDIREVIAGAGLTGGGSTGSVTLNVGAGTGISVQADTVSLSHLGLESLLPTDGDSIFFYDQSAGTSQWLTLGTGLSIAGTVISVSNLPNSSLQNSSVIVSAGNGLTGGGSVSLGGSVTLNIGAGSGIEVSADTVAVDSTVVRTSGDQTISGNKTFSNNVVVNGNFTVNGTVTTVNTEEVNIADNIIVLNSNFTGASPTENGGIEVERGTQTNVQFVWNEASDYWSTVASPFHIGSIATVTSTSSVLVETSGVVQKITPANLVGAGLTLTGTAPIAVAGSAGSYTISVATATESAVGVVELATSAETVTGTDTARATHPAGVKAAIDAAINATGAVANVGDASATSFDITHGLGTRDLIVQVFDNANFETVYTDVERISTSQVRVIFAVAPASNAFRVLMQRVS